MIKKIPFIFIASALLCYAQEPLSPISPPVAQNIIKGKNKSGIIVGLGLGLPSVPTQSLSGNTYTNINSYGYHLLIGYQDFSRIISPLPRNYTGARASFEFSDTYHVGENTLHSMSLLLNYDILIDPLAGQKKNFFGLIAGAHVGWTKISNLQGFSFTVGLKVGMSLIFDNNNRVDITYKFSESGPLKGNQLYFYSPYTIDLTYTYRFDLPKPPPLPPKKNEFDNTKLLIKN